MAATSVQITRERKTYAQAIANGGAMELQPTQHCIVTDEDTLLFRGTEGNGSVFHRALSSHAADGIAPEGAVPYYDAAGRIVFDTDVLSTDGTALTTPEVSTGIINLDTAISVPAYAKGQLYWDADNKTPAVDMDVTGVRQSIGMETYWPLSSNQTGSQINNGQAVYMAGASGHKPLVGLAKADSLTTAGTIGLATHNIGNNEDGYVTSFGLVRDVNTSSWTAGTVLYLSAATAGALTSTPPSSPNVVIKVGKVVDSHVSQGSIAVDVGPCWIGTATFNNIRIGTIDLATGQTYNINGSPHTHAPATLIPGGADRVLYGNHGGTAYTDSEEIKYYNGSLTVSLSQSGTNQLLIQNSSTNALSRSQFQLSAGSTQAYAIAFNENFSTSGYAFAGGLVVDNNGAGGISIAATNAGGDIRLYAGGGSTVRLLVDAAVATWDSAQTVRIGAAGAQSTVSTNTYYAVTKAAGTAGSQLTRNALSMNNDVGVGLVLTCSSDASLSLNSADSTASAVMRISSYSPPT